eukprot:4154829-Prymnesium_polylepis.1
MGKVRVRWTPARGPSFRNFQLLTAGARRPRRTTGLPTAVRCTVRVVNGVHALHVYRSVENSALTALH